MPGLYRRVQAKDAAEYHKLMRRWMAYDGMYPRPLKPPRVEGETVVAAPPAASPDQLTYRELQALVAKQGVGRKVVGAKREWLLAQLAGAG